MAVSVAQASAAMVVDGLPSAVNSDGLGAARDARVNDAGGRQARGAIGEGRAARVLHPPLQYYGAAGDLAAAALDARGIAGRGPTGSSDGPRRPADSGRVATRAGASVDRSFTAGPCMTFDGDSRVAPDLFVARQGLVHPTQKRGSRIDVG